MLWGSTVYVQGVCGDSGFLGVGGLGSFRGLTKGFWGVEAVGVFGMDLGFLTLTAMRRVSFCSIARIVVEVAKLHHPEPDRELSLDICESCGESYSFSGLRHTCSGIGFEA